MRRAFVLALALLILSGTVLFFIPRPALAAPITVTSIYNSRENVSANSVGILSGDALLFGALSVIPDGTQGTTGSATQGTATIPLSFHNFSSTPHDFERAIHYTPALTNSWTLTFTNGSDTTAVQTLAVGSAPLIPFTQSVAISGSGLTPTFTWTVPNGFAPDGVLVKIWDLQRTVGQGATGQIADIVYAAGLPGTATSFTIPTVFSNGNSLAQNHLYAFDIGLAETRGNVPLAGQPSVLSESRSFFDFVPLPSGAPPNVYLPTVIPGSTPVYSFNVAVVGGQQIFIDPKVAIGYDYAIGQGDPKFASVNLPTGIQNSPFDLYLFNGTDWVFDTTLLGGQTFSFGGNGVDQFRILGIDPSLGLDPNNSTAFITGLTFEGGGEFTGTMTPITTDVPEPATMVLLFTGLIGTVSMRKLRSSY